jgi:hypothetical protein
MGRRIGCRAVEEIAPGIWHWTGGGGAREALRDVAENGG